jgi:hypothetical protein
VKDESRDCEKPDKPREIGRNADPVSARAGWNTPVGFSHRAHTQLVRAAVITLVVLEAQIPVQHTAAQPATHLFIPADPRTALFSAYRGARRHAF